MAEPIVSLKTCSMCKVAKLTTEFYVKRDKRDGLSSNCRHCHQHPVKLTDEERRNKLHWRFIDLTGKQFGDWTVLAKSEHRGTQICWTCRCKCGKTKSVEGGNLRSGLSAGCGCLRNQKAGARAYRHGMAGMREYRIWSGMKKRCFNPAEPSYKNYGARGITVCERWSESFSAFYEDMGPRPMQHSIDRIDNNGNYEPGNCRWTTRIVQNRNTRTATMLTINGETMSLRDWADRMNMNFDKLRYRYQHHLEPLFGSALRLTPEEKDRIREIYSIGNETTNSLASKFGVGRQTISNIIHRKHG
jgi:hypothetical protein